MSTNEPRRLPVAELSQAELMREERELSRAMQKLEESNREIKAFDPDGADDVLHQALEENQVAIATKQQRLDDVRRRLTEIRSVQL